MEGNPTMKRLRARDLNILTIATYYYHRRLNDSTTEDSLTFMLVRCSFCFVDAMMMMMMMDKKNISIIGVMGARAKATFLNIFSSLLLSDERNNEVVF